MYVHTLKVNTMILKCFLKVCLLVYLQIKNLDEIAIEIVKTHLKLQGAF